MVIVLFLTYTNNISSIFAIHLYVVNVDIGFQSVLIDCD